MKTYTEPAREIPVADEEEVVVVGGGCAGIVSAAPLSPARGVIC